MISIAKFLNRGSGFRNSGASPPDEFSSALLEALQLLIDGIPLREGDVTGLLQRLQAPLQPRDVLEIAASAVSLFEQDAKNGAALVRRYEDQIEAAGKPEELSRVLLQALKMILEGWPFREQADDGARATLEAMVRRLDGPLEPFDVLEIAGDALAAFEVDARGIRERLHRFQSHYPDQLSELAGASVRAVQILLDGVPCGQARGSPETDTRSIMAELRHRFDEPLAPDEVISIAHQAVRVLQADHNHCRQISPPPEPQPGDDRRAEFSGALLRGLESLLAAVPVSESSDARLPGDLRTLDAARLGSPEEPPDPEIITRIVDRAVAVLKRDAATRRQTSGEQQALADVLHRILKRLLATWRICATDAERDNLGRIDKLLRQLEQPVSSGDLVAIGGASLELIRWDSVSGRAGPESTPARDLHAVDLSEALLQGLRLIIGSLSGGGESAGRPAGRQESIARLLRRLDQPLEPFDVLEIVDQVLALTEQSAKETLERHRLAGEERQTMISMLTEAVARLSVQGNAAVGRLQQIQRRIEQASQIGDLRNLKTSLAECLDAVREAADAQAKHSAENVHLLEHQIQAARSRFPSSSRIAPDSVPHLEPKAESTAAEYLAVFLLDREASIAARFGEDVRQSILRLINQRLREALLPTDRVVRWKGAAFLASLKRTGTGLDVRAELSSVATGQIPTLVEVGKRSIRLPVSLNWAVFPKSAFPSLDRLFEKVDEFIAKTAGSTSLH